ncbi:hypothetical protein B4U79_15036 [Dinothrombium tinctorium]|uniref:Uncharacterized protein n=1 Tax=Dinothrombium tinctorium TaxID=1965070 RepID=A0A443QX35_9ACAR|nr:hypothetical protein B4U79_09678 [Dinothrombium tinctorium]RWS08776.1 hypothetical protein B4U79_15036 [Dinothrombium tinctorium]
MDVDLNKSLTVVDYNTHIEKLQNASEDSLSSFAWSPEMLLRHSPAVDKALRKNYYSF